MKYPESSEQELYVFHWENSAVNKHVSMNFISIKRLICLFISFETSNNSNLMFKPDNFPLNVKLSAYLTLNSKFSSYLTFKRQISCLFVI